MRTSRIGPDLLRFGVPLALLGGAGAYLAAGFGASVSLTLPALLVIFHVLWLEKFLTALLSGTTPKFGWGARLKIFAQIILLAAFVALGHAWPDFSPAGAAIGVTLTMIAVVVAAARTSEREPE